VAEARRRADGAHREPSALHRRGQDRSLQARSLPVLMIAANTSSGAGTAAAPAAAVRTAGGAVLLDGKTVAATVRATVAARAAAFAARHGRRPGLAVVQVGHDPASSVYVRNKRK